MKISVAGFALLLFLLAGCEKDKDPVDDPQDPVIELTDGFCLLDGETVVLNHTDIEYYDYSAHMVYLKSSVSFAEDIEAKGLTAVWAGEEEIYNLSLWPGYLSSWPQGPVVRTVPTFYPDNVMAIDLPWVYGDIFGNIPDARLDSRIEQALKKYGQYREGLMCAVDTIEFHSPGNVVLKLELTNRDDETYYYLDPAKMGLDLFHYFTNGLLLWNADASTVYQNKTDGVVTKPLESWELEWMSLLESNQSVMLTITYDNFEEPVPGDYLAYFSFPGMGSMVDPEELDQAGGRIWLGKIWLSQEVTVD